MTRAAYRENARIAILGAGPAGLATAQYLKERDFKEVLVFERLGRVGGLCKSITDGYESFDLGGNYITPAYRETKRFAKMVGAKTYEAKDYQILSFDEDEKPVWSSVKDYVMRDEQGDRIRPLRMARGFCKFQREWKKVRQHIEPATFRTVHEDPSLHVSFEQWLRDKDLLFMRRIFEIPITMMGYGFLDEIAAPYALRYMEPASFRLLLRRALPPWIARIFLGSVERFELGFQRMWEQVSWGLNVRQGVTVTAIERNLDEGGRPIKITLNHPDRLFNDYEENEVVHYFDKLVIACPLLPEVLWNGAMQLDQTEEEERLFCKVKTFSYCQTTLHAVEVGEDGVEQPYRLPAPVVPVTPFNRNTVGKPWAIVQVHEEASRMLQIYSRLDKNLRNEYGDPACPKDESDGTVDARADQAGGEPEASDALSQTRQWIGGQTDSPLRQLIWMQQFPQDQIVPNARSIIELLNDDNKDLQELARTQANELLDRAKQADLDRKEIIREALDTLEKIGARPAGDATGRPHLKRWRTYHEWPYFGHVEPEDFASFFRDLDQIQGDNDTYYVGGATTFELVESVVQSARYMAGRIEQDLKREVSEGVVHLV